MRTTRGSLAGPQLGSLPDLSDPGEWRLCAEGGQLMASISGGAWGPLVIGAPTPPSVTGSRAGNAALASLLTALATQGLVIDNTTP